MAYEIKTTDPVVLQVIKDLDQRSAVGQVKYDKNLMDSTDDFLQHLKEELLDGINYIQTLQMQKRQI